MKNVEVAETSTGTLDSFLESLQAFLGMKVTVSFEELERVPRERSGKIRYVVSELSE